MSEAASDQVFRDTPWKVGLRALVAFAFIAAGIAMAIGDLHSRRYPEAFSRTLGVVITAFFAWLFLTLFGRLVQPRELILNAKGFRLRGLFLDRFVSWSDVASFDVVEGKLGLMRVVYARKADDAGMAIPIGSQRALRSIDVSAEEGPIEVVRRLKAAFDAYDEDGSPP